MIDRRQFAEVKRLFRESMGLEPAQRRAFLEAHCAAAPEVRAEVEALLERDDAESFLERPALAGGARDMPQAHGALLGQRVGAYRLEELIGTGGMAEVYRARRDDAHYQQVVAIKIVKRGMDTDELLQRFRLERQTLANLSHPFIARLMDGGMTADGRPFLVMEYIAGRPIDEYCDANSLDIDRRLHLLRDICAAVAYAHRQLVIHRDLKPHNVLVTTEGKPKLLDFGVAKLLDTQAVRTQVNTQTGQRLLTPPYASPEQILGGAVGTAADIYSLGVVAYEILAGQRPYELNSASAVEVERTICHHEPPRPSTAVARMMESATDGGAPGLAELSRRRRQLRGDVDTIIMTALRKEPERRYGSVEQFSEDLRRYLEGLPISARPDTLRYRAGKFVRRHAVGVAAAAAFVVLLMVSSVVSWTLYAGAVRSAEQRRLAEENALDRLWDACLAQARAERSSQRPGRRFESLRVLTQAAAIRPALPLRNEAIACMALCDVEIEQRERTTPASDLISVDGLSVPDRIAYGAPDGTVTVVSRDDGRQLARLTGGMRVVRVLKFSPDGCYLAVKHHNETEVRLRVWDLNAAEPEVVVELPALSNTAVAFAPRAQPSEWVALGQPGGMVAVHELPSGALRKTLQAGVQIMDLCSDPDGRKLAVCGVGQPPVRILQLERGVEVGALDAPLPIRGVDWSPDGRLLAGGCEDHRIYLWEAGTGRRRTVLPGHEAPTIRVYFDPTGEYLASRGWDRASRIWDLKHEVAILGPIENWEFTGLGPHFGSWRWSREFAIWHFETGREYTCLHSRSDHSGNPTGMSISPDGRLLLAADARGLRAWDLQRRCELISLHEGQVLSVAMPSGGTEVLAAVEAGLRRWSLGYDGIRLVIRDTDLLWSKPGIRDVVAGPGRLVALCDDGLFLYDPARRRQEKISDREPGTTGLSVSPDGRWACTSTWRGTAARVWDLQGKTAVASFPGYHVQTTFSPDGRRLVVGDGKDYRFYETGSWTAQQRVELDVGEGREVAFTSDGDIAAIACSSFVVKLIRVATGQELATLPNPGHHAVGELRFSPDDTVLVCTAPDRVVQLWNIRLIRAQLRDMGLDWE